MSDYELPTNDRELKEINSQIMADVEKLSGDNSTFYQRYLMCDLIETNKKYVESLT